MRREVSLAASYRHRALQRKPLPSSAEPFAGSNKPIMYQRSPKGSALGSHGRLV